MWTRHLHLILNSSCWLAYIECHRPNKRTPSREISNTAKFHWAVGQTHKMTADIWGRTPTILVWDLVTVKESPNPRPPFHTKASYIGRLLFSCFFLSFLIVWPTVLGCFSNIDIIFLMMKFICWSDERNKMQANSHLQYWLLKATLKSYLATARVL